MCTNDLNFTIPREKRDGRKVVMLSFDIYRVYDCVELNQLGKMPLDLRCWILNVPLFRILIVGSDTVEGQGVLAQGKCFSRVPFNLFMFKLHHV